MGWSETLSTILLSDHNNERKQNDNKVENVNICISTPSRTM